MWAPVAPLPPPPPNPDAPAGARVGARALDTIIELAFGLPTFFSLAAAQRAWAGLFLAVLLVAAYETAFTARLGAPPGKLAVGLRVVELDRPGRPSWSAAWRRGLAMAVLVVLGPLTLGLLWLIVGVSLALSPLHRTLADRIGRTWVVQRGAPPVTGEQLLAIASRVDRPTSGRWGLVAGMSLRRRARVHRLDDSPVLVLAVLTGMLALTLPGRAFLWLALVDLLAWVPLFFADETWRICRLGGTAGHRQAGLVVLDERTGEFPTGGRSLGRAALVACTLYLPWLAIAGAVHWPWLWLAAGLNLIWVIADLATLRLHPTARSLHDLLSGTSVVVDPRLDPDQQRARALALAHRELG